MSRRIEPYWYAIGLVLAAAAALYGYHLATGLTPVSYTHLDVYKRQAFELTRQAAAAFFSG